MIPFDPASRGLEYGFSSDVNLLTSIFRSKLSPYYIRTYVNLGILSSPGR